MERKIAKNAYELIKIWEEDVKFEVDEIDENNRPISNYASAYDFNNIDIDFKLSLPFSKETSREMEDFLFQNISTFKFINCHFLDDFHIGNSTRNLEFTDNCKFEETVSSSWFKNNLTFKNCTIKRLNFEDSIFGSEGGKNGKVRFRGCNLFDTNFRNTTFHGLVDFYNSTFIESVNFYKTDFLNIVVFSATVFKSNVLFTYSLFNDVTIFRGSKFRKGLDLSLAILKGSLSVFDIPVRWWWWEFRSKKGILTEREYENYVSGYEIPVKNKRETFRILKKHYESVNNIGDSVSLAVMEKNTLFVEIISNIFSKNKNKLNWFWFLWGKLLDFFNLLILTLNAISNWHKSSYVTGILFTGIIGALFFNLSISYTSTAENAFTYDWETMKVGFKYYLSFLNPTHNFNYLGEEILKDPNTRNGFYLYDYLGRIFVGYGIYQTIQAFRKFR